MRAGNSGYAARNFVEPERLDVSKIPTRVAEAHRPTDQRVGALRWLDFETARQDLRADRGA